MTRRKNCRITVLAALAMLAVPSLAAAQQEPVAVTAPDETWVSISGTVVGTSEDEFRLDYGEGVMTIEVDDFDDFDESRALMENDQVVVVGRVDQDSFFERRTIEASSVYVEGLGTTFYASAADEEDFVRISYARPVVVGQVEVTGTVTAVQGREFTVSTGNGAIRVDTRSLAYNPMDDRGYQRIGVGDRVKVSGDITNGLFDGHELHADWIITLADRP